MSRPVIGISCSTLVLTGMRGIPRHALSEFYVNCVLEAGGLPLLLPNVTPDLAASYLTRMDGLVLSGGLDVDPEYYDEEPNVKLGNLDQVRDLYELEIIRGAHQAGMPILAICRGVQVLNVAFGGTLVQDIPSQIEGSLKHEQEALRQHALSHTVKIEADTKLFGMAGDANRVRVNSFHHQSVDDVADGFIVTARSPDGVIEAIEDPTHPFCVGVQWHPERLPEEDFTRSLFQHFISASERAAGAGVDRSAESGR